MCISPCVDPPTVTLSIEPRSVLEGERVTFTCQATANPPIMGYRSGWVFFKYVFIGFCSLQAMRNFLMLVLQCR